MNSPEAQASTKWTKNEEHIQTCDILATNPVFNHPVIPFLPLKQQSKHNVTCLPSKTILASGDFCRLLITFANSLDPDQDRQNVSPDLDPNILTI